MSAMTKTSMTKTAMTPRRRVAGQRSRVTTPVTTAPTTAPTAAKRPKPAPARTPREWPSGRRRSRSLLLPLTAALAVLACAAAAWLVVLDSQHQALADARTAALVQARGHAEVILSYSHETLDEDFESALAVSTGEFEQEYRRTSEEAVRRLAEETQATVEAEVVSAGVVSAEPGQVVVLLFVNQTTTSDRLEQPATDLNRVRLTMVDRGGEWLVAAVDAL
jgi:Mce-associated membrane protein